MADESNIRNLVDFWDIARPGGATNYWDTRPGVDPTKSHTQKGIPNALVRRLAFSSLERGMKPEEAVAQGIVESDLGKWDDPENPLHLFVPTHYNPFKQEYGPEILNEDRTQPKDTIDASLNYKKFLQGKYPNDPDKALQAYQGLGKVTKGQDMWTGETHDAGKNLTYTKLVKRIMKTFDDNPHIKMMIDRVKDDFTTEQALQAMGVLP